jgi:hypothetical protein
MFTFLKLYLPEALSSWSFAFLKLCHPEAFSSCLPLWSFIFLKLCHPEALSSWIFIFLDLSWSFIILKLYLPIYLSEALSSSSFVILKLYLPEALLGLPYWATPHNFSLRPQAKSFEVASQVAEFYLPLQQLYLPWATPHNLSLRPRAKSFEADSQVPGYPFYVWASSCEISAWELESALVNFAFISVFEEPYFVMMKP